MSFMFRPFPYVDPEAVNPVRAPQSVKDGLAEGPQAAAGAIAAEIRKGRRTVGIDCYPGVEIQPLRRLLPTC